MKLQPVFLCNKCLRKENKKDRDYTNWKDCKKGKCQGRLSAYYSKDGLKELIEDRMNVLVSDAVVTNWGVMVDPELSIYNELTALLRELEGE